MIHKLLTNPGFLSKGTIAIWGWIGLCCGELFCAFGDIEQYACLYLLVDGSSALLSHDDQKCF